MLRLTIDASRLGDIPALERALGGKFLQAELLSGGKADVTLLPASLDFFVNVWNCQTELYLAHGGECTPAEEVLELVDGELLEELANQVIYEDNNGAINWSGQYFPQSEKSLALFERLMETARPKVRGIV